jgi:hypothetical protein
MGLAASARTGPALSYPSLLSCDARGTGGIFRGARGAAARAAGCCRLAPCQTASSSGAVPVGSALSTAHTGAWSEFLQNGRFGPTKL